MWCLQRCSVSSSGVLSKLRCVVLQVIRMVGESQETVSVGGGSGSSSNKMPTLEEYGTNLTTQATEVGFLGCPGDLANAES